MASAGLRLEIVRILATGGFGTVAVVRDRSSGVHYAAKAIRAEHLYNQKVVLRMRDEAALLTRLHHPHIVRVYGLVHIADRPVVLMEWIRGAPLHEVTSAGRLRPEEAAAIVAQAADALAWAYDAPDPLHGRPLRVIHRDVKPSNLLLTVDGRVKVVDFGIAHGQFEGKASVTNSMVIGTRDYVAPERLDGEADHPAGDVYALGMVLYELLGGGRLDGSMFAEQHQKKLRSQIAALRIPALEIPARVELVTLIRDMCTYNPAERPSHREVQRRLTEFLARTGLPPDLAMLARRAVSPLIDVPNGDVRLHPDHADLRFLEDPAGAAPSEVDERVRAVVGSPGWSSRRAEVARMLADDPTWTPTPFADRLDEANPPGWRFWAERASPDELVALLELVEPRAGPRVLTHARRLQHHADTAVAMAAARLLARHGG